MSWEVRVEFREGGEATLQVGFPTRDAALDYRVRLALWKRVWVQETAPERPGRRPVERRRAPLFDQPYNEDQDAHQSYLDAVSAIGAKVKAGAPIPSFFLPDKETT